MRTASLLVVFCILPQCALAAKPPPFLPQDATEKAACVRALGDVYWNPKKLPFGPTFGAYKGRPVFQEMMISRADFERGKNWNSIAAQIKRYAVDHVDIWYAPHGHDGAQMPHYDIMLFYLPHGQHMKICNPSGKPPSFILQH